jgi:hypothetical protein
MPGGFLILDIETVQDQALPQESSEGEGLAAPPHHEVVCIGVIWLGTDHEVRRIGIVSDGKDEASVLASFSEFMDRHRPTLVTFNGRGFDLPVLAARCLKHGVPFSHYYQGRDVRYRFSPDGHLDLMDYLSDFGAAKRTGLDVSARLCGMPGKVGIDGKDIGPLVHAGRLDEVKHYCLCDVLQTAGIFLRVQLLRGELSRTAYLKAMRGLMRTALADPRFTAVTGTWDTTRLLLGEKLEAQDDVAPEKPGVHCEGVREELGHDEVPREVLEDAERVPGVEEHVA